MPATVFANCKSSAPSTTADGVTECVRHASSTRHRNRGDAGIGQQTDRHLADAGRGACDEGRGERQVRHTTRLACGPPSNDSAQEFKSVVQGPQHQRATRPSAGVARSHHSCDVDIGTRTHGDQWVADCDPFDTEAPTTNTGGPRRWLANERLRLSGVSRRAGSSTRPYKHRPEDDNHGGDNACIGRCPRLRKGTHYRNQSRRPSSVWNT
jgi:hypothetical protein